MRGVRAGGRAGGRTAAEEVKIAEMAGETPWSCGSWFSLTGLVLPADISASNRLTERNSEVSPTVVRRFEFG